MKINRILIVIVFCLSVLSCRQENKKPLVISQLFSDHMVLQQKQEVNFWGQYTPEKEVTLSASWGKQVSAMTDIKGNWEMKIGTPAAGGPFTIKIETSDTTLIINDVLIGEVWLASGQSNMDLPLKGWLPNDTVRNSKQEIANASYPDIRLLKVPFNISVTPVDSVQGKWISASPETAGDFSAAAYFYARKLHQELNVPIGIIQSSIGGTPAEAWTSKASLAKLGDFDQRIGELDQLQNTINGWNKRWTLQTVPRSDEDWNKLNLFDNSAAEVQFDDSKWDTMNLPGRFDRLTSGEFDGVMWLRKVFVIQDSTADYVLYIGSVDDMDAAYINGQKVGETMQSGFASTPREMTIPKSVLRSGENTIAIRAIDTGGPGFINGPITISNQNGKVLSLEGEWKSKLVAENISGKFFAYGLNADISGRPDVSQLNSNSPTVLFNAMIHPLIPYTIKGAIWYQGESNVGRAEQYKKLFPIMISDWRNSWGYEFPFYYVQIAPFLYDAKDQKGQSAKLRDAQRYALKLSKTGMVVTLDIGKLESAHPSYKKEVGERLALYALANDYGKELVTSGPLFKQVEKIGTQLSIEFTPESIGSGLIASVNGLNNFEIAGGDKVYVLAQAKIVGDKVVVSAPSVKKPEFVRYAWTDGAAASLFNKEGLPASTFTSEEE